MALPERLIRTIKEEEVDLSDYADFATYAHRVNRPLHRWSNEARFTRRWAILPWRSSEAAWRQEHEQPSQVTKIGIIASKIPGPLHLLTSFALPLLVRLVQYK